MKIRNLFSVAALVIASSITQAEIKLFEANNINSFSSNIYPNLDLNGLDQIKISVDNKISQDNPAPTFDLKRIEFKFPNANNLVATNFTKLINTPDTYRAVVTSPWVFKKVMVEVNSHDFYEKNRFTYRVIVMDNTSSINNIEQTQGFDLFGGDAELVDTSPKKVVDVVRTNYLDKPLTLRLLSNASPEGIKIEAIWLGHGTKILTLPFPIYPEQKPISLILETVFDEKFIKVRLDDAYNGPETPEERLHSLLEQAFGPLPYPEAPLP